MLFPLVCGKHGFSFYCRMVRTYKRKSDDPRKYSEEAIAKALLDIADGIPQRVAARRYDIPQATLRRRYLGLVKSPGKAGRKTALLRNEEFALAGNLAVLGDFGLAFDSKELRDFIKIFLDSHSRKIAQFKDNRLGPDWVGGFLKRHSHLLSSRMCQNISRKRAAVSETVVSEYFNNLEKTVEGVPPTNIVNYDETNITDDPKGKLQIFRRGTKHAERIMNTTKSSTSIMFAITASGHNLSPCVVYKGERLQTAWIENGPIDVVYNVTKSGWFDSLTFIDWFQKIILPYMKILPVEEPKVLIGDNLASHINHTVVQLCERHNIRMVFLPPNSTHLLQPLDVAVFSSLKNEWRKIITQWKLTTGKHCTTLPKSMIPPLILKLEIAMNDKWADLAKAGFRACGIHPFNKDHVLAKVRRVPEEELGGSEHVSPAFLTYLQQQRELSVPTRGRSTRGRGGRQHIPPGQSMSLKDLQEAGSSNSQGRKPMATGTKRKLEFDATSSSEDSHVEESQELGSDSEDEQKIRAIPIGLSRNREARSDTGLKVKDYVLVRFEGEKKQWPRHYVGKVCTVLEDTIEVDFYRKAESKNRKLSPKLMAFCAPPNKDVYQVKKKTVVKTLQLKHTHRAKLFFNIDEFMGLLVR